MTPSLRSHIAAALREKDGGTESDPFYFGLADALLVDPTLAAILDLAEMFVVVAASSYLDQLHQASPEVRALLAEWRVTK